MASEKTYMDKLREARAKQNFLPLSKDAFAWYRQYITKRGTTMNLRALLRSEKNRVTTELRPGKMVIFGYDAKTKDTLPYFDAVPLDIVLSVYEKGWTALNLHYIPPAHRAYVLDKIISVKKLKNITPRTRISVTYNLLKNVAQIPEINFGIKRYLYSQTRSAFIGVPVVEWDSVIFLPLANWKSSTMASPSNRKVWSDYRKSL